MIEQLYAYTVTDSDGEEGVLCTEDASPLMAQEFTLAIALKGEADKAAAMMGMAWKLKRFEYAATIANGDK